MRTLFVVLLVALAGAAQAEPASMVYLNGTPSPVFFNDGDSFRVLEGPLAGTKARLAGYNTLESFGPVHRWGSWTFKELYVIAKLATYNARKGVWHCESDMSTDTYGRTLWWCEDLATDQVRKGLAHAMSITSGPAKSVLVKAQKEAIAARRGIWSHGVPEYIVTSLHSVVERPGKEDENYNRLVSSVDGHSLKWKHKDAYDECSTHCWGVEGRERRLFDRMMTHEAVAALAKVYDEARLKMLLARYRNDGKLGAVGPEGLIEEGHREPFLKAFKAMDDGGWIAAASSDLQACMIYVDFRRHYGTRKASCLR